MTLSPVRRVFSPLCVRVVKAFEGFRARTYRDVAGHATIGYGHLVREGELFDEPIPESEGQALLGQDLLEADQAVGRLVRVGLAQWERDALVSFVFNLGAGRLEESALLRRLNSEDRRGAAHEFLRWVHARDPQSGELVVKRGLLRRRHCESVLFLGAADGTVLYLAEGQ